MLCVVLSKDIFIEFIIYSFLLGKRDCLANSVIYIIGYDISYLYFYILIYKKMKSICYLGIIILCISVSLFGCSKDVVVDGQSQVERCWTIKSNATQLPIEGARLNIIYDWPGSNLGPFLNLADSDVNGKACATFHSSYFITSFSAFAAGYEAHSFPSQAIPSIIYLEPLE